MSPLLTHTRRLLQDESGVAAVIFALMVPAFIGGGALAIDMSLYRFVDNRLQSAADAAALAAVKSLDNPQLAVAEAVDFADRNVPDGFGTVTMSSDIDVGIYDPATGTFQVATGSDVNAVRVNAVRSPERGNGVPRILSVIWGSEQQTISATAIAARQLKVQYQPPERQKLDSEAGDFNEIYAYCYKYGGSGSAASRRSQMTLVSNNMAVGENIVSISGGKITVNPPSDEDLVWPECEKDESLSFRLRNVRHAKNLPELWADPTKKPRRPEHNYFTDTELVDGVEKFHLGASVLETVRCDTLDQCDPKKAGNIIPSGKNRTPVIEPTPCLPGKFMYFGWEDRPPGQSGKSGTWTDPAWTDKDYDDIVMVMRCPNSGILGDGMSRLVG
jgi:hypothetical protein